MAEDGRGKVTYKVNIEPYLNLGLLTFQFPCALQFKIQNYYIGLYLNISEAY